MEPKSTADVLADYARLQGGGVWRHSETSVGIFENDADKRIVACDPAAALSAAPLERALPPGSYDVFLLPAPNGRAAALLLRWRQGKKTRVAESVEVGGDVAIDTAGIMVLSQANAQRLRSHPDAAGVVRRLAEAPMGRFDVEWDDGFVTGYATLTLGDGVASVSWLLDRRKQVAGLHVQLPR